MVTGGLAGIIYSYIPWHQIISQIQLRFKQGNLTNIETPQIDLEPANVEMHNRSTPSPSSSVQRASIQSVERNIGQTSNGNTENEPASANQLRQRPPRSGSATTTSVERPQSAGDIDSTADTPNLIDSFYVPSIKYAIAQTIVFFSLLVTILCYQITIVNPFSNPRFFLFNDVGRYNQ